MSRYNDEEALTELADLLHKTLEASIATDDMLALLCIQFASAAPEAAGALRDTLARLTASAEVGRTVAFDALARRLMPSLGGSEDLEMKSARTRQRRDRATLQRLLLLIEGGRS